MEPEGSLPHSQVPATCLYPETDQSSLCPTSSILKIHLNIILPHKPESSIWSLSLRNSHQNLHKPVLFPIRATCSAHIILLDLITRITGEQYRSLRTSLFSFLQFPVTLSLLGPNILLNHPILTHPQTTFLPQCERQIFTPNTIQQAKLQFCMSKYLYFWIAKWKKTLGAACYLVWLKN